MLSDQELMKQAAMTATEYMNLGIHAIDERFGEEGYAKAHPQLLAAFMNTAALDYGTCALRNTIDDAVDRVIMEMSDK